jgi:hypothetical protein
MTQPTLTADKGRLQMRLTKNDMRTLMLSEVDHLFHLREYPAQEIFNRAQRLVELAEELLRMDDDKA